LTVREQEILRGLGDGLSNLEIAGKLELSPKTVRNYLLNIYSKLQVRDRVQAALFAREQGR
jgi:DNA-binding NarL/FixJ family response regulator